MENPKERIPEAQVLYEFRPVFLPKKGGDFRPIAISEIFLTVFHKILKNRLIA